MRGKGFDLGGGSINGRDDLSDGGRDGGLGFRFFGSGGAGADGCCGGSCKNEVSRRIGERDLEVRKAAYGLHRAGAGCWRSGQ